MFTAVVGLLTWAPDLHPCFGETSTHSVAGSLVWVSAEALGRQASEGGAPPLALPWQCGWQLLLPSLKIRRPPICL